MLSWVVKVVPQPPEPPQKIGEENKPNKPAAPPAPEKKVTFKDDIKKEAPAKPKEVENATPESMPQAGMMSWISQGIASALPQPVGTPPLSTIQENKDENAVSSAPGEENTGGVISWIAKGIEKVVPQPDGKYSEGPEKNELTEVHEMNKEPDPLSNATVVEVESDHEDTADKNKASSMIDWIKHGIEKVVPQPEFHTQVQADAAAKKEPASQEKVAVTSLPKQQLEECEAGQQTNMVGWIVQGFGRILPQPVLKTDGADDVQNISIVQDPSDMVLEEVDPNWDKENKENEEQQQEMPPQHPRITDMQAEDAETQTERWTPLMDSIKKEAADSVLAHMEDRLQQERLEAARIAESMARKAAEAAVRQLEQEHSAKIVLGSQDEGNEQLPNILEEENEDDPELQNLLESDESTENKNPEESPGARDRREITLSDEIRISENSGIQQENGSKEESRYLEKVTVTAASLEGDGKHGRTELNDFGSEKQVVADEEIIFKMTKISENQTLVEEVKVIKQIVKSVVISNSESLTVMQQDSGKPERPSGVEMVLNTGNMQEDRVIGNVTNTESCQESATITKSTPAVKGITQEKESLNLDDDNKRANTLSSSECCDKHKSTSSQANNTSSDQCIVQEKQINQHNDTKDSLVQSIEKELEITEKSGDDVVVATMTVFKDETVAEDGEGKTQTQLLVQTINLGEKKVAVVSENDSEGSKGMEVGYFCETENTEQYQNNESPKMQNEIENSTKVKGLEDKGEEKASEFNKIPAERSKTEILAGEEGERSKQGGITETFEKFEIRASSAPPQLTAITGGNQNPTSVELEKAAFSLFETLEISVNESHIPEKTDTLAGSVPDNTNERKHQITETNRMLETNKKGACEEDERIPELTAVDSYEYTGERRTNVGNSISIPSNANDLIPNMSVEKTEMEEIPHATIERAIETHAEEKQLESVRSYDTQLANREGSISNDKGVEYINIREDTVTLRIPTSTDNSNNFGVGTDKSGGAVKIINDTVEDLAAPSLSEQRKDLERMNVITNTNTINNKITTTTMEMTVETTDITSDTHGTATAPDCMRGLAEVKESEDLKLSQDNQLILERSHEEMTEMEEVRATNSLKSIKEGAATLESEGVMKEAEQNVVAEEPKVSEEANVIGDHTSPEENKQHQ